MVSTLEAPFEKAWWVQPSMLLAGPYPGVHRDEKASRERLASLLHAGIRTFIDLQEPEERRLGGDPFPDYFPTLLALDVPSARHVQVLRLPIADFGVTSPPRVAFALDVIDASLSQALPVYIHCFGGRGRSALVVGCWLRRHELGPAEALQYIARLRAGHVDPSSEAAPETEEQRAFVRNWREPVG